MTDLNALIERLEKLDAERTPGEWEVCFKSGGPLTGTEAQLAALMDCEAFELDEMRFHIGDTEIASGAFDSRQSDAGHRRAALEWLKTIITECPRPESSTGPHQGVGGGFGGVASGRRRAPTQGAQP